ncbi:MAG TPA: Fe-S-containing protein, partial [Bacteroidota bacterium]
GKLVTAMSKSEHCGSTDFYLSGNNIHCASCGSYWNMASMEAYACCQRYYPDPVPSVVSGDMVLIESIVVRGWKSRL